MISPNDIRERLKGTEWTADPFHTIRDISYVCAKQPNSGRELVVYALDRRHQLPQAMQEVLDELTMAVGLYPYVENLHELSFSRALEHASHTAEGVLDQVILHSSQARVFEKLLDGESVILSAPTSYGKSLLIDAYIAASDHSTVIIIVPTIALIEETRRRMAKFSDSFTVVTTTDQTLGARNILVLTQERYLSMRHDLPDPDFFVIDEFYKLDLSADKARSNLLNQAFLHLHASGSQFYLLGPSVHAISQEVLDALSCTVIDEDFHTVALDLHFLEKAPSKPRVLVKTLESVQGQTLVYCKSPPSTRRLINELLEIGYGEADVAPELAEAADWAAENFHNDWLVSQALRHGIGIHHGRVPRALARFMVKSFEDGKLRTLLCTSTLIEGVNTTARNVIVFDNQIDRQKLDFFTFNNIKGRSGRMFQHFVGHVYLFDPPPEKELPLVDMPAFNPTAQTPSSILMQKEYDALPEDAQVKIDPLRNQDVLPLELLTRHSSIEPEHLVRAGTYLNDTSTATLLHFSWSGFPSYDELKAVCGVIWDDLHGAPAARQSGMRSASMMTYWVWDLYRKSDVARFRRQMIRNQIDTRKMPPDDAVEDVLRFLRNWASFNFPKFLMAVNDIARVVLERRSIGTCDYTPFAAAMENLFQPHTFATLEEYGLPVELASKLERERVFDQDDGLDTVIRKIRVASTRRSSDSGFERSVLGDFLDGL